MIRKCHCGAMFAPHNPHQYECDACEVRAGQADQAVLDLELEIGRAKSEAFFQERAA